PGTIPDHARPPGEPTAAADGSTGTVAGRTGPRVATAEGSSGSLFSNMFASGSGSSGRKEVPSTSDMLDRMSQWMGLKRTDPAAPAGTSVPVPKVKPGSGKAAPAAPGLAATSAPAATAASGTGRAKPQADPDAKASAPAPTASATSSKPTSPQQVPQPPQQASAVPTSPAP